MIVMMVLLKDACTCTSPTGTFFFSFFLKVFFFAGGLRWCFSPCISLRT